MKTVSTNAKALTGPFEVTSQLVAVSKADNIVAPSNKEVQLLIVTGTMTVLL